MEDNVLSVLLTTVTNVFLIQPMLIKMTMILYVQIVKEILSEISIQLQMQMVVRDQTAIFQIARTAISMNKPWMKLVTDVPLVAQVKMDNHVSLMI